MASVLHFPSGAGSFDPDTNRAMATAFEQAWKKIEQSEGLLAKNERAEVMRSTLAKRIIYLARMGERDPIVLCSLALDPKYRGSPPQAAE
jgi:hypothetical protein